MTNFYPHLSQSFKNTKILQKGNYPYPISPFAGVSPVEPEIIREISQAAQREKLFSAVTLIVSFESAGGQLAAIIGQAIHLPYLVARKKKFELPNEISFSVTTNFDEKKFYLYGNFRQEKILIVDDVVASGTTINNAALALQAAGAEVIAFFAIATKDNLIGKRYQDILRNTNIPLISMLKIQVIGDKVEIL